jgi:predicted negative regulator of RcsB-dependent stress response
MSDKLKVDLNELERALNYLKTINQHELKNIEWWRGDVEVKPSDKLIEEFRFTGLSNVDFAEVNLLIW